jgi:hypothetical protein
MPVYGTIIMQKLSEAGDYLRAITGNDNLRAAAMDIMVLSTEMTNVLGTLNIAYVLPSPITSITPVDLSAPAPAPVSTTTTTTAAKSTSAAGTIRRR